MNNKVLELAEQAGYQEGFRFALEDFDLEKFAELLVKECANVAADHDALDIYEEIREHFEVEE